MDIKKDHSQVEYVMQLVNDDGWDQTMLQSNFDCDVCIHIHNVLENLVLTQGRDKPWWIPSDLENSRQEQHGFMQTREGANREYS